MAIRKRLYHPDEVREKIQASQLINLLNSVALTGRDCQGQEVNPVRIDAAKTLLRKVLPDLASVEHSGEIVRRDVKAMPETEIDRALNARLAQGEKEQASSASKSQRTH